MTRMALHPLIWSPSLVYCEPVCVCVCVCVCEMMKVSRINKLT